MSAAMVNPVMQPPHRKPLPTYASANTSQPGMQYQQQRPYPGQPQDQYYSRAPSIASMQPNGSAQMNAYGQPTRRTLSNATSSTSSTNTSAGLQRAPTGQSFQNTAPRRSTSSRSTASASPTSYVALMRKQKATVWCDRAQHEDPRILAAQRAAKMRAAMEVAGGQKHAPAARASTSSTGMVGGVRSKIRHHGAPKASTYTGQTNMVGGVGVPMRLSASEVDENDSDEDVAGAYASKYHTRNGSGRSSLGSGHRGQNPPASGRGYSSGSTPPSGQSPVESMGDLVEEETPVPNQSGLQSDDYFAQPGGQGGSGSSEERFGAPGRLPQTQRAPVPEQRKTSEELRRRGSVDDRTMTMSAGRLFVANPDLSD